MTYISLKGLACGCPHCASQLPVSRTLWKRGEPFDCARCHQRIVVPSISPVLPIAVLAVLSMFLKVIPLLVIATVIVGGLLLNWLMASARPASAAAMEAPEPEPQPVAKARARTKSLERAS